MHNKGVPLPVDEFVRRSRELIAARQHRFLSELGDNVQPFALMPETPENIERVKSMLAAIPADIRRDPWMRVVWAVESTGWDCAKLLAQDWSKTAPEQWNERDFERVWSSFDPGREKSIGFGTLDHIARNHEWPAGEAANTGDIVLHILLRCHPSSNSTGLMCLPSD